LWFRASGRRTLGPDFVGTHDFQSCPFNRSGISPHFAMFGVMSS